MRFLTHREIFRRRAVRSAASSNSSAAHGTGTLQASKVRWRWECRREIGLGALHHARKSDDRLVMEAGQAGDLGRALPCWVWASRQPSPVITRSDEVIFPPGRGGWRWRRSRGSMVASQKVMRPKPRPPVAPAPGMSQKSRPSCRAERSAILAEAELQQLDHVRRRAFRAVHRHGWLRWGRAGGSSHRRGRRYGRTVLGPGDRNATDHRVVAGEGDISLSEAS